MVEGLNIFSQESGFSSIAAKLVTTPWNEESHTFYTNLAPTIKMELVLASNVEVTRDRLMSLAGINESALTPNEQEQIIHFFTENSMVTQTPPVMDGAMPTYKLTETYLKAVPEEMQSAYTAVGLATYSERAKVVRTETSSFPRLDSSCTTGQS